MDIDDPLAGNNHDADLEYDQEQEDDTNVQVNNPLKNLA